MSMEGAAWSSLYRLSHSKDQKTFSRDTVRRTFTFAAPYKGKITVFVLLSVVTAALAVATPVLAGRVVDAIVAKTDIELVVWLAVVIALVAIADAGLSMVTRWISSGLGEDIILDLRTAVFDHVQKMPIAFFMRTRTGALVSRLNNDVIGAQRAFAGTLSGVVSNVVALILTLIVMLNTSWQVTLLAAVAAADLPAACPPDGQPAGGPAARDRQPQFRHEYPDDRAVLRSRSHAGQAVRPARPTNRASSSCGRSASATSASSCGDAVGLRYRTDPGLGAGAGPGLRAGRVTTRSSASWSRATW